MEYFSHDYNAREDEKIQKLIYKHDWEAYGLYWALVEMLYQNDGFIEPECDRIAFVLRADEKLIRSILFDFNLFIEQGKRITSKSVLHRLKQRKGKSEQARQAAEIRWSKEKAKDANAMQPHSERNAIKESKVKESKENKKKYSEFVFLKEQEYRTLIEKFGESNTKKCIEVLNNYKGSKGKTYKSDYHAIISWVTDKVGVNLNADRSDKLKKQTDDYFQKLKQADERFRAENNI